jgi:phage terminase small subunit
MALADPQQEEFCQHRANQKSAIEAYTLAGYKPDRANAARLTTKNHIRQRIAEIQEKRFEKVGWQVEDAVASMREIVDSVRSSKSAKDSDRVAAARAAASWLGWEKQTTPQAVPVVIITIGGSNSNGAHD